MDACKTLTVNDFFCGCGGVALGFQNAGFKIIWACDLDKYAVQTYRHNVGNQAIQADVMKLSWADIPQADVWAFGFPCQDLSVAGQKRGFRFQCKKCGTEWDLGNDSRIELHCPYCASTDYIVLTRSALFFEIMRLLDEMMQNAPEKLPKALFIENVKGLRKYLDVLRVELQKRNYKAHIQLYNSKYWGVPQNRERYYIVGTSYNLKGFVFPTEQHDYVPKLSTVLEKDVDDKYFISDEKAKPVIKQALEKLKKLGRIHAVVTPDRINKRQNGRRAKECEEEMFTLTAQDIHGVMMYEGDINELNNTGLILKKNGTIVRNITDVSYVLMARDYKGFWLQERTAVLVYDERIKTNE